MTKKAYVQGKTQSRMTEQQVSNQEEKITLFKHLTVQKMAFGKKIKGVLQLSETEHVLTSKL